MSDPIERQAAIDALDEQIRQCDKALSAFDISMKDEYAVNVERASLVAFRETLEYMPSAQPGWIPVTERLPEEETIYLVTFGSGHVRLSSWHKDTKYNHGFDNIETGFLEDGTIVHFGVTAWMPLPKPWEGGQNG